MLSEMPPVSTFDRVDSGICVASLNRFSVQCRARRSSRMRAPIAEGWARVMSAALGAPAGVWVRLWIMACRRMTFPYRKICQTGKYRK